MPQRSIPAPDSVERLLEHIQRGTDQERSAALETLGKRAEVGGQAEDWSRYGLGLLAAGQLQAAQEVFEVLAKQEPTVDQHRLNLAVIYAQRHQYEIARYYLDYVAQKGTSEEGRKIGREQLAALTRDLSASDPNQQLHRRERTSLEKRVASRQATPEDYRLLGRLLIQESRGGEDLLRETASILETGHTRFPLDSGLLELLIYCYLRSDPNHRLDDVVLALDKLDPNSEILRTLRSQPNDQAEPHRRELLDRAYDLLQLTQQADPTLQAAALEELRKLVARFPENLHYQCLYAFALGGCGQKDEALRQAAIIARNAGDSYSLHFNLGQIFWLVGDQAQGRSHLDLAYAYAPNGNERASVNKLVSELNRSLGT